MSISAGDQITCIINGIGQRLCAGVAWYGQFGAPVNPKYNSVPVATVIPDALAPTSFAVPPPFVAISDDASGAPACSLLLSVKVAATCEDPPMFDPPLLSFSASATSAAGAVVTFTATVNKPGVAVTCAPASGSTFAVGTTPVTCTAGATTETFNVGCAARRGVEGAGSLLPAVSQGRDLRRGLPGPPLNAEPAARAPATPPARPPTHHQVIITRVTPILLADATSGYYEASTAAPYLGTTLAGTYAPKAFDVVEGDISAFIRTYLDTTNELIDLATYVFPLGTTHVRLLVANSFGLTAEKTVSIWVRDTTPPAVAVAAPAEVVVAPGAAIDFEGKV
jgi:hypothetical protein